MVSSKPTSRPSHGHTSSITAASPATSAPRSVPSPAHFVPTPQSTHTQKAGKSPYKHPSTSTPRSEGMGSSPATASTALAGPAAMKRGPSAMSNVGTPISLQNALLDAGNIASLVVGTPGGGILSVPTTGAPTRDTEAIRARRMAEIVELLGTRWGLVSQEGVERCAKRLGLECLWEDASTAQKALGQRTLSIAGNGLLVDVEFRGEEVKRVVLSFPGSGEGWGQGVEKGAAILLQDLRGGGGYVKLEKFAKDLGGLAALDALGRDGVSCFDALEGIGEALKKVWGFEVEDGELEGTERGRKEVEVVCEKGGRPRIHEDEVMGLRVDYWVSRRLIPSSRQSLASAPSTSSASTKSPTSNTYALHLTCQSHLATLYPSVRVSSSWLGDPVSKPSDLTDDLFGTTSSPVVNWLDPAPTFTTEPSSLHAMNLDGAADPLLAQQPQLPNIRFLARVEPPVVLPLQAALSLFDALGAIPNQDSLDSTPYISLLLPNVKVDAQQTMTLPPPIIHPLRSSKRTQAYSEDGTSISVLHDFALLKPPPESGMTICEIPFAHPNQLAMVLQVLRQWVLVATFVTNAFARADTAATAGASNTSSTRPITASEPRPGEPSSRKRKRRSERADDSSSTDSDTDTASDTNADSSGDQSPSSSPISSRSSSSSTRIQRIAHDVQLTLGPVPRFAVITAIRGDGGRDEHARRRQTAALSFEIRDNAEIAMGELDLDREGEDEEEEDDDEEEERQKGRVKRVLEVSEDLGVWGSWVGMRR